MHHMRMGVRLLNTSFKTIHIRKKEKRKKKHRVYHGNGNKYIVFGKMHRTSAKVNGVT